MPTPTGQNAPTPAYIARIAPFDLDSAPIRQVRLSARQIDALDGLEVPVALDPRSSLLPCAQAELVIQDAVARLLKGRAVSAVLWRDRDAGDVSVWHDGGFVPVASVELTPARERVAA